jgi:hypothetical protein
MTNVIQLRPYGTRGEAEAVTLVDAFGLAIVATASWNRLVDHIAMEHFGYAGAEMPLDPATARYGGADRTVWDILDQCNVLTGPLPPLLRAMMIDLEMWVDEDPALTARTFQEAFESLEAILAVTRDQVTEHAARSTKA